MIHDFSEELFTNHDLVLQVAGQRVLRRMAVIPNPSLTHEIEAGAVNDGDAFTLRIGTEEDRGAEDSLKRAHEPPILGSTLLHAESVQHLCRSAESNDSTALFDCQRREEDRYQAVLTPWQPVGWMAGDLKKKLPVSTLVQKLPRRRPLHWQAAQNEGPRSESEILVCFLPLHPHAGNRLRSTKLLFRDDEVTANLAKNRSGRFETAGNA